MGETRSLLARTGLGHHSPGRHGGNDDSLGHYGSLAKFVRPSATLPYPKGTLCMGKMRHMAGRPPSFPVAELEERVARAAAHRKFSQHGYEATTIDTIVAASGVSKPVIYRAFGSKSKLYCTMLERFANELAAAAMESFHQSDGTMVEQLRAIIESWFAALEGRQDEWRM